MELLLVIAVLGLLFVVILPQFSKTRELQVLKNAVGGVASSLSQARSRTLASVDSFSYGVHFQTDKIVIFKGTRFVEGAPTNEILNLTEPATIATIAITGGGNDIYFARLNGVPNTTGSIIVSTSNYSKTITISATGAVSIN